MPDVRSSNLSRRTFIKGAAAAIPVIMTLQSGAALARTSNLVGAITDTEAAAKDGVNLICVRPDLDGDVGSNPVDLGTDPIASVDATKLADNVNPDLARQVEKCNSEMGGHGPGILVSAVAWDSISSRPNLNL